MFITFILSRMFSFRSLSLLVLPHAHLHIFISATSSLFVDFFVWGSVSSPYSKAGWITVWWIFPFTLAGILLSHITPDIFFQLFHPDCILLLVSASTPPSVCSVLQRYLNSFTSGSCWSCICTLPLDNPLRHMYSVFALYTFIPLFSKTLGHLSRSSSSPAFSSPQRTTSSANIMLHGTSFLMSSVRVSMMMANRNGLRAEP